MSKPNDPTIEKIIRLMRADRATDAPADAVRWSKNLFRARVAKPKQSLAQKVLAVLQMDLSGARPAFGERSASASQARQMFFRAGEDAAIDLRIKETENNFSIHGQILGADFGGAVVRLNEFETTANALGEFKFAQVPRGEFELSLRRGEQEIVIENLQVN